MSHEERLGEAVLRRHDYGPGSVERLWSAAEVWQLFPPDKTTDMDAHLRAWCDRMAKLAPPADSACMVNWPSHDAHAIRAFLDHGFVPISILATRTSPPGEVVTVDGVTIRRAREADFEAVLGMAISTFDYTGLVSSPKRPETEELLRPQLKRQFEGDQLVWIAERGGEVIAAAECGWVESEPDSWAAELLPHGRWGYVNNVVTAPGARGGGLGQALMSLVHNEFHHAGAVGTYLYYNPPNPLASVFWPRQGYRPLWTIWEVRPASAIR
ncbi:Acetyltransferase (GNAT) domain-containing protein [Amycolatopsis xylanica]|uniref:Acetyltransferase (GNAT) domain-containing protein n=1 Tax=Amycolatopsis xylanica TaxID=589385 RepID=A0A1H3S0P9_9PSEU|nr:GNAT family N-acetyltransferase [Amycolatopsis xylanica]SDZ31576.1 Acetyltransferase (GNAT) domain-containing protein [Amycolatopsis xylanica]